MEEDDPRSFSPRARWRPSGEDAKRAAGILGAVGLIVAVVTGGRVALRLARLARDGARVAYAAATLRLYRRCPACRRWIRGDARVCSRCGWRRRGRRWPRPRVGF